MTTMIAPAPPPAPPPPTVVPGERVLLPRVSWATNTALLADIGDDAAARLTYDNGWLEIEMPGWLPELIAALVGEMVTATLKRQRVAYAPGRATTWRQAGASRGLQADDCYYVQSLPRVAGKLALDLAVDPPPDLAVEVEVESPLLDKVAVYRGLSVPELWRVRADGTCDMLRLDADGAYQPISASEAVPRLTPVIVSRYARLLMESDFPTALARFEVEFLATVSA